MADNIQIGTNIKQIRKEKRLTQKQLAELIGKTESSVQKYESGKVAIPINVLELIATALDCQLIQLYGITSDSFLERLRKSNRDPFLIYLDSLGYEITINGRGGLLIKLPNGKIPLIQKQYKSLEEKVISYIKFLIEYENILHYPLSEFPNSPAD